MTILFIDSTYDITLGLLDEQLVWKDLKKFSGQKASSVLQNETYSLLNSHGIKLQELKAVVSVAGPGFYTGLRLSEGFADVMSFFKIPVYSFYSHSIPLWTGVKSGVWATKAYRGEYFFHRWTENLSENILVEAKNLESFVNSISGPFFIHSESALDKKMLELMKDKVSNLTLLEKNPTVIFSEIISKQIQEESYYFRAPEDEFRTSG